MGRKLVRFVLATALAGLVVSAFLVSVGTQSAEADSQHSKEMKRIFDEDQKDRAVPVATMSAREQLEWANTIGPRDAQRRKRVMELIKANALQTGDDFEEAAFVFQHGENPEDFLLAHTLAVVAIAKGKSKARWIAAATLDRYLQRIKQPQIFGTQYFEGPGSSDKFTQAPYNRDLVPDALRKDICVPDLNSQKKTLKALNEGKDFSPAHVPGC